MNAASSQPPLAGRTVLRFVHAFKSGGGMERIMADLDGILLERNPMTIVRMYIGEAGESETVQAIGRGTLVMVPLPLAAGDSRQIASDHEQTHPTFKQVLRDRVLYHPLVWPMLGRRYVLRRRLRHRRGEVVGAGRRFVELAGRHAIDLCLLHFFGGSDADEVLQAARARGIPVALQNHFSNDRFDNLAIRKHALLADAVAGMNGLDVPPYLRDRFTNLADGIDMACFDPRAAVRPAALPDAPVIFLPSRIVRPKGHLDVVRAAARLKQQGIPAAVAFAGRVDSEAFLEELKREIVGLGLEGAVHFLGALKPSELRDWYAASAVLAFPTYHHEGLGRIIVEAQAMKTPVVAYATGGVPEGVRDGSTGFLVRTGDLDTFTEKLRLLITQPGRRAEMGERGREFVLEHYSLDALARRHEQFYQSVMRPAAAGR